MKTVECTSDPNTVGILFEVRGFLYHHLITESDPISNQECLGKLCEFVGIKEALYVDSYNHPISGFPVLDENSNEFKVLTFDVSKHKEDIYIDYFHFRKIDGKWDFVQHPYNFIIKDEQGRHYMGF